MTKDGINFERSAILKWLKEEDVCPVTSKPLTQSCLVHNSKLQNEIDDWQLFGGTSSSSTTSCSSCITPPTKKMNDFMTTGNTMRLSSSILRNMPTSRGIGDADRFKKRFAKTDLISALDNALNISDFKL